jgi:hypothetical protein
MAFVQREGVMAKDPHVLNNIMDVSPLKPDHNHPKKNPTMAVLPHHVPRIF